MKSYLPAALFGTVLTVGAIGFGAATAHAAVDIANRSAGSTATALRNLDDAVQFSGTVDGNRAAYRVSGVNGLSVKPSGAVYVTVSCPDAR